MPDAPRSIGLNAMSREEYRQKCAAALAYISALARSAAAPFRAAMHRLAGSFPLIAVIDCILKGEKPVEAPTR